jgi:hypothetical protein
VEETCVILIDVALEISSGSWICLFNDPSGATFAMLQQAAKAPEAEEGE